MGNAELKRISSHNLGNGVRPILESSELLMGFDKAFFLKMQPNFVAHLKLVWHPILFMSVFVLGIRILKDVVNLLADVLDAFNKSICFFSLGQYMCG